MIKLLITFLLGLNLFANSDCLDTTSTIFRTSIGQVIKLEILTKGLYTISFEVKNQGRQKDTFDFSIIGDGVAHTISRSYQLKKGWNQITFTFKKRSGSKNEKLIISGDGLLIRNIKIKTPYFFSDKLKGSLGISYSGYRKGQTPGHHIPTTKQILEDLDLLVKYGFGYIRMYGSDAYAEKTLRLIREYNYPIKMVLGAWVEPETSRHGMDDNIFDLGPKIPELVKKNKDEISRNINLANEYSDIVVAINVGNEVLTFWSTHKVPYDSIVNYVQQVKHETGLPVSVAENHSFWLSDESNWLAGEVDFIMLHTYPQWENVSIDRAIGQTIDQYYGAKYKHNMHVMIGEDGWTTSNNGNPQIIAHEANESNQARYYHQLMPWAQGEDIRITYFEFSDEPWKGGGDLTEPETNWGIFREDRSPKPVIKEH